MSYNRLSGSSIGCATYEELGAIRPDELYLLGLDDKDTSDAHDYFRPLHTYLFWGQEALDIAAALREKQE